MMQPSSFGQYFVFLGYIVWAPLTLKVGSRSLEHLDLRSQITAVPNLNKVARFHRLVHSIESKQEATPCMSEVLATKAMFFPLLCLMDEITTLFFHLMTYPADMTLFK